jgi:hypothetical protein
MPWIEDLKYAEYWRKLSPKTPKGIEIIVETYTSVSGEQPSTSHLDVQSQPTSQTRLCPRADGA